LRQLLGHEDWVNSGEFNRDGKLIVTASNDRTARIWNLGRPWAPTILKHDGRVVAAHFSDGGEAVITASEDGTVRCWTLDGEPLIDPIRLDEEIRDARLVSGGAAVVVFSSGRLTFWRFEGGLFERRPVVGSGPRSSGQALLASADGGVAFVLSEKRRLQPIRLRGPALPAISLNAECENPTLSPDGRLLACESERVLGIVRTDGGQRQDLPVKVPPHHKVAFSRDSRFLAVDIPTGEVGEGLSRPCTVVVFDALTGDQVGPPESGRPMLHDNSVYGMRFDPRGRFLVTASSDGLVRVWDWRSGRLVDSAGELSHRAEDIKSHAEFDAEGKRIVYSSWDRTATIWTLGDERKVVLRHVGEVDYATFSPDGRLIVTASWDHTARLWDSTTGALVGTPMQHQNELHYAAFSSAGDKVATVDEHGSARIWDASTGLPITQPLREGLDMGGFPYFALGGEVFFTLDASGLRITPLTHTSAREAKRLADLAEAIGGFRLDSNGALQPGGDRHQLLLRIVSGADRESTPSVAVTVSRWLLTDPHQRTISPFSTMTSDEYARLAWAGEASEPRAAVAILFPWKRDPGRR
jgi:WD40 repeat protein